MRHSARRWNGTRRRRGSALPGMMTRCCAGIPAPGSLRITGSSSRARRRGWSTWSRADNWTSIRCSDRESVSSGFSVCAGFAGRTACFGAPIIERFSRDAEDSACRVAEVDVRTAVPSTLSRTRLRHEADDAYVIASYASDEDDVFSFPALEGVGVVDGQEALVAVAYQHHRLRLPFREPPRLLQ